MTPLYPTSFCDVLKLTKLQDYMMQSYFAQKPQGTVTNSTIFIPYLPIDFVILFWLYKTPDDFIQQCTGDGWSQPRQNWVKRFKIIPAFIILFWLLNTSQFILRRGQGLNVYCVYVIYMTPSSLFMTPSFLATSPHLPSKIWRPPPPSDIVNEWSLSRGDGSCEEVAINRFKPFQQGIQHETRQHIDKVSSLFTKCLYLTFSLPDRTKLSPLLFYPV